MQIQFVWKGAEITSSTGAFLSPVYLGVAAIYNTCRWVTVRQQHRPRAVEEGEVGRGAPQGVQPQQQEETKPNEVVWEISVVFCAIPSLHAPTEQGQADGTSIPQWGGSGVCSACTAMFLLRLKAEARSRGKNVPVGVKGKIPQLVLHKLGCTMAWSRAVMWRPIHKPQLWKVQIISVMFITIAW